MFGVKCRLFHLSAQHTPLPPCLPPWLAVHRGLCGSDCGASLEEFGSGRGLESRPTLSPIQRPALCEVGKFHSAIQLNGSHKGDYKPQRIPVGTWERRRCEGGGRTGVTRQRGVINTGQYWGPHKTSLSTGSREVFSLFLGEREE